MNNFKQLQKRTACKKWIAGEKVYIVPCKVYPDFSNPWIIPFLMSSLEKVKTEIYNGSEKTEKELFNSYIDNYIYYNCQYNETGKYPHFYILEK